MSKRLILSIAVILAFVLTGCAQEAPAQSDPTIQIGDAQYAVSSVSLDLSGTSLTEWEKLTQFPSLKQLDLRNTGITTGTYEQLRDALPECDILWSVPFQNGHYDSDTVSLILTSLTDADLNALQYFPMLQTIEAEGCTDYAQLAKLAELRPDLEIRHTITLGGTAYDSDVEVLELKDPDIDELQNLRYLPRLTTVTLTGTLPDAEHLIALKEAYPNITFVWDFDCFGIPVNTLTEFVDLSGISMEDTAALEALLPCFYHLQKVDMVDCGLSNEEMDALNRNHPDTRFIWEVVVCTIPVRTDITYFMPVKYDLRDHLTNDFSALRYCPDIVVIDLGHYVVNDLSFVKYLPKLEYLQLCGATIDDISAIGDCTSLRMLELFLNPVTDFWPLTNLTNLEDLNISYTPALTRYEPRKFGNLGDITPLLQMTWLDRLWVAGHIITEEEQQTLLEALPNTIMHFEPGSSTNHGWRYCPNYYTARDILEMWYMHI